MTGAEVCDPGVINVWKTGLPAVRVINVYGPTEATIVCVAHEIAEADHERVGSYPIGRPLRGWWRGSWPRTAARSANPGGPVSCGSGARR